MLKEKYELQYTGWWGDPVWVIKNVYIITRITKVHILLFIFFVAYDVLKARGMP